MGTNRFFNRFNHEGEQNLQEDLVVECIQQYGIDIIYIPRTQQKLDKLYGEDVLTQFDDYYDIEMYIENVDQFEGGGDIFSKFGIDIKDQGTLLVSRARFKQVVEGYSPFDIVPARPREGDLIFFPLNEALFEIKFVNDEKMFYPFGALYVYSLQVEQFAYSHEEFETGIEEIDKVEKQFDHSVFLHFASGANSFIEDEIVYQGTYPDPNEPHAVVTYSHDDTKTEIRDIVGEFRVGENVFGLTSGTSRILTAYNDQDLVKDYSAVNADIEAEADDIIDFSESNPFSEDDY